MNIYRSYVINLERRPDRWSSITAHLSTHGLPHERFRAVDAADPEDAPGLSDSFISLSEAAVVESHRRLWMSIPEAGHDFALIMEDDCRLDAAYQWVDLLDELCRGMELNKLDVLQLGFLTFGMRGRILYRGRELIAQTRPTPRTIHLSSGRGESLQATLGTFRAGSHCYLMSRKGAQHLAEVSQPYLFNSDGLLARLAETQTWSGRIRFARLNRPIAYQGESACRPASDSDNH